MQAAMAPHWRQLVTRNASGQADSKGQVWAVPYRWGCTLVAFNTDNLCRLKCLSVQHALFWLVV